jgi:hypothetical protein
VLAGGCVGATVLVQGANVLVGASVLVGARVLIDVSVTV